MALWTATNGKDGDGKGVYGRLFNKDGSYNSSQYRFNQETAGN